jgi:hypothetical protein
VFICAQLIVRCFLLIQITTGTRNTLAVRKPNAVTSAQAAATENDDAQSEHGENDGNSGHAAAGGTAVSAAMKAKKRRVGGVNIFPGMRKVRYLCVFFFHCTRLVYNWPSTLCAEIVQRPS